LSQINQGAGVTSKLKKVDPSQQTHKNPELRAGSVVSEKGESCSSRQLQIVPDRSFIQFSCACASHQTQTFYVDSETSCGDQARRYQVDRRK
jgi:hypothetical protein